MLNWYETFSQMSDRSTLSPVCAWSLKCWAEQVSQAKEAEHIDRAHRKYSSEWSEQMPLIKKDCI